MPLFLFTSPFAGSSRAAAVLMAAMFALSAHAEVSRPPEQQKSKAAPPAPAATAAAAESDASRYCAAVAPTIAEARIAWQTKRLAELDAQLKQRIADLEKAEAAARDWIGRRDEAMKAANDEVVAIYAKMEKENAARQISAMDDRTASAILAKMKPGAAAAIFSEMEAERASRLSALIASGGEKKS